LEDNTITAKSKATCVKALKDKLKIEEEEKRLEQLNSMFNEMDEFTLAISEKYTSSHILV
jgi:hypothetical protein